MGSLHAKSSPDYADVPATLNHDNFDMQNQGRDADLPVTRYDSAGDITPYLGLRARLSQIWLNRWTVLLLLVLVRVVILLSQLHDDITNSKADALSACTKVEDVGSAMASMPHYLSVGVNDLAANGISQTVQGLVEVLGYILTGVEQLILFVVNFYVGTYVCLSSALIHGGLDVGIGAADETTKLMNDAIGDIATTIEKDASSVQDAINAAFSTIASASSIFGDGLTAPTINLTAPLDDLRNIHVDDTSFVKTLQTLNTTIPTYDQVESFAKSALAVPFDAVKTVLNDTYGSYTFDSSVFPVAKKQALTFCSDNDVITDFFDALFSLAEHAKTIFVSVLVVLAVLIWLPMAWLEVRRFRHEQRLARLLTQRAYDPMDTIYIGSRPFTAQAGIRAASRFISIKRQLLVRWAWAYATSLPALFVLSLAVAGAFSCICQAIMLRVVQREAPALASEVSSFADDVVKSLEAVSTEWANDANGVLLGFQDDINHDLLGYVVNATTAVNNTLNGFMDDITTAINDVFNGTVLDNTVQQIVRCLIGIKIDSVEEGLTWVHDRAHVTLPLFPNDTFSDGAAKSISGDTSLTSFLASPGAVTSDAITGAVDRIVDHLRNGLIQEALITAGLLLVYVIVMLMGIVWAAFGMMRPEVTRAEGGQRFNPTAADLSGAHDTTTAAAAVAPAFTSGSKGGHHGGPAATAEKPFFPHFGNSPETAAVDDYAAATFRDEKLAAADVEARTRDRSRAVSGRRVVEEKKGHWRGSSYGDVMDAGGR